MDEPEKRARARELLCRQEGGIPFCISTQVMQEFYVLATRKLHIDPLKAKDILYSFRHFEVGVVDPDDILRAVDGNVLWQISFWDALIVTAAQKMRGELLYTEDLNDGYEFDSLKVVNPFS
jgi:predicted nucleic acid-binding protein